MLFAGCADDTTSTVSPAPPDASQSDAPADRGRTDADARDAMIPKDRALRDSPDDGDNAADTSMDVGLDAIVDASMPALLDADAEGSIEDSGTDASVDSAATETGPDSEPTDASGSDEAHDAKGESGVNDGGDEAEAGAAPFDNPSCVGVAPTCGSTGNQDCCHRATIVGGSFLRSYDGVGFTDPSYGATVSSFALDTFEVSVGRFRAFVRAGFGTQVKPPPAGSGAVAGASNSGWSSGDDGNLAADVAALAAGLNCSASYQTWTDTPSSNESRPINCVTWYEAFAFCVWDGARLPTEAEWNYAAAGGSEQRVYPWSVPASSAGISETNASYWVDPARQCFGDGVNGCTLSDLIRVGGKPAGRGRWGHADLGGNVWEWTRDTFNQPYGSTNCIDCVDVSRGGMKVIRGGSFFGTSSTLLASGRSQGAATTRYYTVGIRCAR